MSIAVPLLLNINIILSLFEFVLQKLKIPLIFLYCSPPILTSLKVTTLWKLIMLGVCIFILHMCVSIHNNYSAFEYFKALCQRGEAIGIILKFFFIHHHLMSCVRISCPIWGHKDWLLWFFLVLPPKFSSMVHSELIFVYDMR